MRRPASTPTFPLSGGELDQAEAGAAEGDDQEEDEDDLPSAPVRKGTMSKDIHDPIPGLSNFELKTVMAKLQYLGLLLLITPPVLILVYVTGKCVGLEAANL